MRREPNDCHRSEQQSACDRFERLLSPEMELDAQVATLEVLNRRTLQGEELAAMAQMLLDRCRPVDGVPENAIDLCGTGGDCSGTFNISTVAAFVVAGAGIPVVKHGNRSITSQCGSVDCLEELGIGADLQPDDVAPFLEETGIVFLFAPIYHPAVGVVGKARRVLCTRGSKTVFNILGPLVNPAFVSRRSLGVFSEELILPVAEALRHLGVRSAMVYHGNGQDEVTLTGVTHFARLAEGEITQGTISPEELGLARCTIDELAGGDAADNARIARSILEGEISGPRRDIVTLNAAVAIQVESDGKPSLLECLARAVDSIDSGRAASSLNRTAERSGT